MQLEVDYQTSICVDYPKWAVVHEKYHHRVNHIEHYLPHIYLMSTSLVVAKRDAVVAELRKLT